jgi:hypothetical protein
MAGMTTIEEHEAEGDLKRIYAEQRQQAGDLATALVACWTSGRGITKTAGRRMTEGVSGARPTDENPLELPAGKCYFRERPMLALRRRLSSSLCAIADRCASSCRKTFQCPFPIALTNRVCTVRHLGRLF